MRLDKFLKVSRVIKRRSVANDVCSAGRLMVNGKVSKPSVRLKTGDVVSIAFGKRLLVMAPSPELFLRENIYDSLSQNGYMQSIFLSLYHNTCQICSRIIRKPDNMSGHIEKRGF